jgi:DNA ligase-1
MNKPMLATPCPVSLRGLDYPVAVEHKFDGVRCIAIKDDLGEVRLFSRNMKEFENFEEVVQFCKEHMEPGTVWDGEITSEDFQKLMTRTHASTGLNDDVAIMYNVFDVIPLPDFYAGKCSTPYHERRQSPFITNGYGIAHTQEELLEFYDSAIKAGFEGVMVKNLYSHYVSGRTRQWLKLKPVDNADLCVVGVEEGKGKHKGVLGALLCEYGDVFARVGTGFTDAQRKRMWEEKDRIIGKIAEIEYQSITKPNKKGIKSLRFPVFKCIRLDKDDNA